MTEGFTINELAAFLLSEIIRLNANSKLMITLLREKGLMPEYEARYTDTLKATIDEILENFPSLQPFLNELKQRLSDGETKDSEEETADKEG